MEKNVSTCSCFSCFSWHSPLEENFDALEGDGEDKHRKRENGERARIRILGCINDWTRRLFFSFFFPTWHQRLSSRYTTLWDLPVAGGKSPAGARACAQLLILQISGWARLTCILPAPSARRVLLLLEKRFSGKLTSCMIYDDDERTESQRKQETPPWRCESVWTTALI